LAKRLGSQFIFELPDEVPVAFIEAILGEANGTSPTESPFGIAAFGERTDLETLKNARAFRELPSVRYGSRLVVCYSSDYKSQATFKNVYPRLFGASFPMRSTQAGDQQGAVGLDQLADEISSVVLELCDSRMPWLEIREAVGFISEFLAAAYSAEGNTNASWVASWWYHIDRWLEALGAGISLGEDKDGEIGLLPLVYGCAGLPRPNAGAEYDRVDPVDYFRVLEDRWSSVEAVVGELDRLEYTKSVGDAVDALRGLPWTEQLEVGAGRDVSVLRSVAFVGLHTHRELRSTAWALLPESAFFSDPTEISGLTLVRGGAELPRPWPEAPQFLAISADDVVGELPLVAEISDLEFVVPLERVPTGPDDELLQSLTAKQIHLEISAGNVELLGLRGVTVSDGSVSLGLSIRLTLTRALKGLQQVRVRVSGPPARLTGDLATAMVCIVTPNQVALVDAPGNARSSKRRTGTSVHRHEAPGESQRVRVKDGGQRRFALYIGTGDPIVHQGISLSGGGQEVELQGSAADERMFTAAPLVVSHEQFIHCNDVRLFEFEIDDARHRPLSPLIAACDGIAPSTETRLDLLESSLGDLEFTLTKVLINLDGGASGEALGHIALTSSRAEHPLQQSDSGVLVSRALASLFSTRIPGPPSERLLGLASYGRLRNAYRSLEMPRRLSELELEEKTSGLIPSRLPFRDLPRGIVDELLEAYCQLQQECAASCPPQDQFWARFPMSVAVFSDTPGDPTCQCVLLSCLHPIRLAWRWELESAFHCVHDETGTAPRMARLTEGWTFPAITVFETGFAGGVVPMVSVPIHTGPQQVFVGWSALARLPLGAPSEPVSPEWLNGKRFPAGASSGLSGAAVSAAIREFTRVFPQVRTLSIDLPVPQKTPRSQDVDEAIGRALGALVRAPDGESALPGGIRVFDTSWRLGPIPDPTTLIATSEDGRPVRKFEWTVYEGNVGADAVAPHLRLAQSHSTLAAVGYVATDGGSIPKVPLRRFPVRTRTAQGITTNYSVAEGGNAPGLFLQAIAACEGWSSDRAPAVTLMASGALHQVSTADWVVSGDFGLDPATLQALAVSQSDRHMLWEWRPAVAMDSNRADISIEQRPYVTVSRVPPGLSASLREKVSLLLPDSADVSIESCVDDVVRTLAQRGIGLNSLLAMGHHHSTGALGFYFALTLLIKWCNEAPVKASRLVMPIDAIDSLLRSIVGNAPADMQRRADLLAIEVDASNSPPCITLIPIEIKHYGLSDEESSSGFPAPGEARLKEHVDQLVQYKKLLNEIAGLRTSVSDTHRALIDCAIYGVLDAATLLNPELLNEGAGPVHAVMSSPRFELRTARGVLVWFQRGGCFEGEASARWEAVEDETGESHAELFIDPLRLWQEFWGGQCKNPLEELGEVISWCMEQMADTHQRRGAMATASEQTDEVIARQNTPVPEATPPIASGKGPTGTGGSAEIAGVEPVSESTGRVVRRAVTRGLGQEELKRRYQRILATFQEFNVSVEAPAAEEDRYSEGPASIVFSVRPGRGVSGSRVVAQLGNLRLRLNLGRDQQIGAYIDEGLVRLDVPKADGERYYVDAADMWARWQASGRNFAVPIGEDRRGEIVTVDFSNANSPHLLIAGTTGSGKSEALLTLLSSATHYYSSSQLKLLLIDPKGTELRPFEKSSHLLGSIGWTPTDAVHLLDRGIAEMERRYKAFRESVSCARSLADYNQSVESGDHLPRWLIVLDEYADLTIDPRDKKEIEDRLRKLAAKARAAGIHLIVSTQKPTVEVINTVVRSNLPAQLALRTKTSQESNVIMDDTGAETLTGKGDAFLKIGAQKDRVQCAKVS
jgi:hypothetical protein